MTALAADNLSRRWYQGHPRRQMRVSQFAASKVAWIGSLCMAVDDVGMPALSGALLAAQCTTIAGADGNGGMVLRARQPRITVQLQAGAFGVASITYGATIDVLLNIGAPVTAEVMCNLIRGNAELDRLLACKSTGTGAGLVVVTAATPIAHIRLLGPPERRIDNTASGSPVVMLPSIVFRLGVWGMDADVPPLKVGDNVAIVDDATLTKTADPLNFRGPLIAIDDISPAYFIDLEQVQ